jgi:hypothetical protein
MLNNNSVPASVECRASATLKHGIKATLTPFQNVPYNPPPILRGSTDWTMRGHCLLNLEMEFCDE